jgi:hypothetical protein
MGFSEIFRNLQQLWEDRPTTIVLLVAGFVGFLILVVDAWRHKRRRKRPR